MLAIPLFPYIVLAASHKIQGNRQRRKFMPKTNNSPTPDTQIRKDKMRLTVTNIYPAFQNKSEQETRQEIGAQLYQIFKKICQCMTHYMQDSQSRKRTAFPQKASLRIADTKPTGKNQMGYCLQTRPYQPFHFRFCKHDGDLSRTDRRQSIRLSKSFALQTVTSKSKNHESLGHTVLRTI